MRKEEREKEVCSYSVTRKKREERGKRRKERERGGQNSLACMAKIEGKSLYHRDENLLCHIKIYLIYYIITFSTF